MAHPDVVSALLRQQRKTDLLANTFDAMPPVTQHLHDDIVRGIIDSVQSDHPTLTSCARVNRQFASYARQHLFKRVHLRSSPTEVSRINALSELIQSNPSLLEHTTQLKLELGDGHRWIFSRILTPPFRTSDPSIYTALRSQRAELDETISSLLLRMGGGVARNLRVLVLSHCNFYPVLPVPEVMKGWEQVFGIETLEKIALWDIADFPLGLLGKVKSARLREVEFLRVKLDRRDTVQMWSEASTVASEGGRVECVRLKVFSIRDCYSETIDPIIACALNPGTFLDFLELEELTVHPCLAVQTPSYNKLVKAVISQSKVLTHLIWMSSAQHQAKDLEVLADFTRFKKVDLIFVDGFGGFPQLLTDIRDLLRAASSQPLPSPLGSQSLESSSPAGSGTSRRSSALEELNLRFDLENLTMHATPESIMPGSSSNNSLGKETGSDSDAQANVLCCPRGPGLQLAAATVASTSLYYAPIKYYWKLEEGDLQLLREIDGMLAASPSGEESGMGQVGLGARISSPCPCGGGGDDHTSAPLVTPVLARADGTALGVPKDSKSEGFPNFKRLSTTCLYNSSLSFMLDDWKALDVYEACKLFVAGGLPLLEKEGKLHFVFEKT